MFHHIRLISFVLSEYATLWSLEPDHHSVRIVYMMFTKMSLLCCIYDCKFLIITFFLLRNSGWTTFSQECFCLLQKCVLQIVSPIGVSHRVCKEMLIISLHDF